MKQEIIKTAKHFGIYEKLQSLETDLLKIPNVKNIDFDLNGLYDNIHQIIFLAEYDIVRKGATYYTEQQKLVRDIEQTATTHHLYATGDSIEDYGTSLYFVRSYDDTWKRKQ